LLLLLLSSPSFCKNKGEEGGNRDVRARRENVEKEIERCDFELRKKQEKRKRERERERERGRRK